MNRGGGFVHDFHGHFGSDAVHGDEQFEKSEIFFGPKAVKRQGVLAHMGVNPQGKVLPGQSGECFWRGDQITDSIGEEDEGARFFVQDGTGEEADHRLSV